MGENLRNVTTVSSRIRSPATIATAVAVADVIVRHFIGVDISIATAPEESGCYVASRALMIAVSWEVIDVAKFKSKKVCQ